MFAIHGLANTSLSMMLRSSAVVESFLSGRTGVCGGVATGVVSKGRSFSVLAVVASTSLRLDLCNILACRKVYVVCRAANLCTKHFSAAAMVVILVLEEWRGIVMRLSYEKEEQKQ